MSVKHHGQRLDRLRTFLRTGEGFNPDDAELLVASLDRYFDQCCSLDEAMGVRRGPGENHPGAAMRFEKRNAAVRCAAALNGALIPANFKTLAEKWERYHASGWRHERTLDSCPAHRAGRIEGYFWEALKAYDRVLGPKQIQEIVGTSVEVNLAFSLPRTATNS
jgi:hypothetical protein